MARPFHWVRRFGGTIGRGTHRQNPGSRAAFIERNEELISMRVQGAIGSASCAFVPSASRSSRAQTQKVLALGALNSPLFSTTYTTSFVGVNFECSSGAGVKSP